MILIIIMILAPVHAEEKKIKIKFFFAENCDHCKKAEGYFEGLKKEYNNALDIEMIDVFTPKGYKEFKEYGFVMTPGIVFNDQIKIEGETTEEELRNIIEYFLTPKKVVIRMFYDKKNKNVEYNRIHNILSGIKNKDVGILYLDYNNNRNDFLYFGFSKTPSVAINEISFEKNIDEELIDSVINFYLDEKQIKLICFYSDEEEKKVVEDVINSRYREKVSVLWIDINKNDKEFYLDGFSETPSVVINDRKRIEKVTEIDLIKGLEEADPKFYTPIKIYLIAYPYLKYTLILLGIVCIGLYRYFL